MSKMIETSEKDSERGLSPKSGFVFGLLAGVAVAVAGAAAVICAVKLKEKWQGETEEDFVEISEDDDYVEIPTEPSEEPGEPETEQETVEPEE